MAASSVCPDHFERLKI